jgi:hypothetical protein
MRTGERNVGTPATVRKADQSVAAKPLLPYGRTMFGMTKRTMKTMTPSGGVPRVCAR